MKTEHGWRKGKHLCCYRIETAVTGTITQGVGSASHVSVTARGTQGNDRQGGKDDGEKGPELWVFSPTSKATLL